MDIHRCSEHSAREMRNRRPTPDCGQAAPQADGASPATRWSSPLELPAGPAGGPWLASPAWTCCRRPCPRPSASFHRMQRNRRPGGPRPVCRPVACERGPRPRRDARADGPGAARQFARERPLADEEGLNRANGRRVWGVLRRKRHATPPTRRWIPYTTHERLSERHAIFGVARLGNERAAVVPATKGSPTRRVWPSWRNVDYLVPIAPVQDIRRRLDLSPGLTLFFCYPARGWHFCTSGVGLLARGRDNSLQPSSCVLPRAASPQTPVIIHSSTAYFVPLPPRVRSARLTGLIHHAFLTSFLARRLSSSDKTQSRPPSPSGAAFSSSHSSSSMLATMRSCVTLEKDSLTP